MQQQNDESNKRRSNRRSSNGQRATVATQELQPIEACNVVGNTFCQPFGRVLVCLSTGSVAASESRLCVFIALVPPATVAGAAAAAVVVSVCRCHCPCNSCCVCKIDGHMYWPQAAQRQRQLLWLPPSHHHPYRAGDWEIG